MTSDSGSPDTDPDSGTDSGTGTGSDQMKLVLRRVFESQIPNYGDYNLVCATPAGEEAGFYVLGYRWRPAELVFAPFDVDSLAGVEAPTAVNTTNLSHTDELGTDAYEVGTSTGRIFRFSVEPQATLPGAGTRTLEQAADWEDFRSFVDSYLELA